MFGTSTVDERFADQGESHFMNGIEPLLPMAYRLAYGLLRRPEEAEDAVQEATFKAWRRRTTFRPGSDIRPWFLAIVANECRQTARGHWWSVVRMAEPEPEPGGVRSVGSEDLWNLRAALARL